MNNMYNLICHFAEVAKREVISGVGYVKPQDLQGPSRFDSVSIVGNS